VASEKPAGWSDQEWAGLQRNRAAWMQEQTAGGASSGSGVDPLGATQPGTAPVDPLGATQVGGLGSAPGASAASAHAPASAPGAPAPRNAGLQTPGVSWPEGVPRVPGGPGEGANGYSGSTIDPRQRPDDHAGRDVMMYGVFGAAAMRVARGIQEGPPEHVERVNPQYPPPPGTPEQLEQAQNDISDILARRAAQEQAAAHNAHQVTVVEQQGAHLDQHDARLATSQSAVQAHNANVQRKQQANTQKQPKTTQAKSKVEEYADRKAGIEALKAPLGIWKSATGAVMGADWLPHDVTASLRGMNSDAGRFEKQLTALDVQMTQQIAASAEQTAQGLAEQATLGTVAQQAQGSTSQLDTAKTSMDQLKQSNTQKGQLAQQGQAQAQQRSAQLGAAAAQRQQQHDNLAARLQAWATAHRAARMTALEETQTHLREQHMTIRKVREH